MAKGKVLVVDDEQSVATTIKIILEPDGNEVTAVTSGKEALAQLREHEFDVVLTDLRLDDFDGIEVLRETQKLWPDTVAIMLTGHASLESAVAASRGRYGFADSELTSLKGPPPSSVWAARFTLTTAPRRSRTTIPLGTTSSRASCSAESSARLCRARTGSVTSTTEMLMPASVPGSGCNATSA